MLDDQTTRICGTVAEPDSAVDRAGNRIRIETAALAILSIFAAGLCVAFGRGIGRAKLCAVMDTQPGVLSSFFRGHTLLQGFKELFTLLDAKFCLIHVFSVLGESLPQQRLFSTDCGVRVSLHDYFVGFGGSILNTDFRSVIVTWVQNAIHFFIVIMGSDFG